MRYKINCRMYREEYMGNPGAVPYCNMTGQIEPNCVKCTMPLVTNADRIRQMTDAELAEWIAKDLIEPGYDMYDRTYQWWLSWLKKEVDDDG